VRVLRSPPSVEQESQDVSAQVTVALIAAGASVVVSSVTAGLGYVAIRRFRLNNVAVHQEEQLGDGKVHALTSLLVVLTAFGGLLYVAVA